ncbi:SPFH domain-containing protein, partial [Streptomyces sp. NPDC058204]
MTTTTSQTPGPDGPSRPARLIQNEATTEIPVHLLFRDEPEPRPVPLGPAVVAGRPRPAPGGQAAAAGGRP